MKDWNFGYLGKGIDGYAHYMQAYTRNFPPNSQSSSQIRLKPKERTHVVLEKRNRKQEKFLEIIVKLADFFIIGLILLGAVSRFL